MTIDTNKVLYNVKETCYLLCISRPTLGKLCKAGRLHPIKLGTDVKSGVRFSPADLENFANERATHA